MRKILSVILSVAMVFSLFSMVSFGTSAEEAGAYVIKNNSDEEGATYYEHTEQGNTGFLRSYNNETLNFEGNQAVFYENNVLTDPGVVNVLDSADESHGNVMAFKWLKVYRDGWDSDNITQWPSAFVLCDSAGENRLFFKAGEQFRISFAMKKNSAVPTDFFTSFKAALIFGEELMSVNGHMGSLNPYINNEKNVTLAEIDCTADDDWVTYSTVVTAPCSGAAAFLLYGTNWQVPCDIYVDNITLTVARNGDVNADNEVDILDLVHMKKIAANVIEVPAAADLNYDGKVGDAADLSLLRKALLGIVSLPCKD